MLTMDTENFLRKCFKRDASIVSRKIAGEFILVPIRSKTADIDGLYTLNEVAARIWELADGKRTVQEIRDAMVEEYAVESAEAEKDLVEMLQQLESIGVLAEV